MLAVEMETLCDEFIRRQYREESAVKQPAEETPVERAPVRKEKAVAAKGE